MCVVAVVAEVAVVIVMGVVIVVYVRMFGGGIVSLTLSGFVSTPKPRYPLLHAEICAAGQTLQTP